MPDPESAARASLRRSLAVYTLFLITAILVFVWVAANRQGGGSFVTLVIVGIVALLLIVQVVQHLRDMNAPLAETEGPIVRKWKRADLIIAWDSYYISVGRSVFKIQPEDYIHLAEQRRVTVVHFPRTLHVVSVQEGAPVA